MTNRETSGGWESILCALQIICKHGCLTLHTGAHFHSLTPQGHTQHKDTVHVLSVSMCTAVMNNHSASAGLFLTPKWRLELAIYHDIWKSKLKNYFAKKKIFEVLETNFHMSDPSLGTGFLILVWPQSAGFQTWLDFFLSQFSQSMQIFNWWPNFSCRLPCVESV